MAAALRVQGTCSRCGHVVKTTAPAGKATWRGPCPKDGCGTQVIARRVKTDAKPAAEEEPAEEPRHGADSVGGQSVPASTSDPLKNPSPRFQAPLPSIAPPPSPWPNPDPENLEGLPDESGQPDGEPALTRVSTDVPAAPGGDPEKVAKVLGGLLVIVVASLSVLARRRGRAIRPPTPRQRDDIARPVARVLVRHLPLDALGPDLVDITEAAVATHEYLLDGPLVTDAEPPEVDIEIPEFVSEEY